MKPLKTLQRFISDYLPLKISNENIRFILVFLIFLFAALLLVTFIEYKRQNF